MKRFLLLLLTGSAFAGPIANGDFEIALGTEWTAKAVVPSGASSPPTSTITRVAGTRGSAGQLDVTGRDHVQDGPTQGSPLSSAFRDALRLAGSGRTYTTRLWVKLAPPHAEASVRCLLRYRVNNVPQIPLILAETVVTQSNTWVQLDGTATLAWAGTPTALTAATLDFEVEQLHSGATYPPPASWFPSYSLDDLQMELDTDGDGLWDSEESFDHTQTTLPFADVADSDGDRMPDAWEVAHHLNPRDPGDALESADSDEFTNVQEYFAATDPESAASYPGLASDSQATPLARAFLRYLALRPWQQQRLIGQHVTDNSIDYTGYWLPIGDTVNGGRFPAFLSLTVEGPSVPLQITTSIDYAIPHALAGGVPLVKWAMWNPWRAHLAGTGQTGRTGDLAAIDIAGILDPAFAAPINTPPQTPPPGASASNAVARSILDGWIDSVAAEIARYNAATGGTPMLFRPLSEMNGSWFWWGHRTRSEYLGLWNHIRDRLTLPAPNGHGFHNLIWVYESASSEHVHPVAGGTAAASDYYYPGDDRVDVFTHNLYSDTWVLPFDANKVYAKHPKIYGVPQAGPAGTGAVAHTFDNQTYLTQIATRYPRMAFFITWNGWTNHDDDDNNPTTSDFNDDADPLTIDTPTHKHMGIAENAHAFEVMTSSAIVTRDELAWRPPLGFSIAGTSSIQVTAQWTPPTDGDSGVYLEMSPDGVSGWDIAALTAPGAISTSAICLPPGGTGWFRLRAMHGAEDSLPTDPLPATTWTYLQEWKHHTLGDLNASSTADPDLDGTNNLLEYLYGTDPLMASASQTPACGQVMLAGQTYLTLTFRRRIGAGVTSTVLCSGDLVAWTSDPVPFGTPVLNADGTETVTYRDIVPISGATQRYLRLQVSAP